MYGTPQSTPHQVSHPPPVGYSRYSYDHTQAPAQVSRQPSTSEYDVHSQVYRPSEEEAHNSHAQKHAQKAMKNPGQRPQKLEDTAAKMESGVNRFLKKLEKKLG